MKELKIKIWNEENVVLMKVLQQDESLRGKGIIYKASNGFVIESWWYPNLYSYFIQIKGEHRKLDNIVCCRDFATTQEAEEYVEKVKEAIKEYNESIKEEILTKEEKEAIKEYNESIKEEILTKEEKEAIKEYNESIKEEILTKEEKEYIKAFIKPFKDEVEWIAKYSYFFGTTNEEYISIKLFKKGFIFPTFEKGTMYRGMETEKRYTLEELGL